MNRGGKKNGQNNFANMVSEARRKRRLSQRHLGEQIQTAKRPNGVWNTYVGQIEKGEKVPSDEVVLKLAEVLELNPSEVLLAAYEARAESDEASALFRQMEMVLTDPIVQRLLAVDEPLDPGVLEALGDENIRGALKEEKWCRVFARIYQNRKKRDIQGLLDLVSAMNDKQWTAMMNILETMDIEVSRD
jgi:transcriptional regulator with XRE-family HTH domain